MATNRTSYHFGAKATATNHTSLKWGTASRPKQRQQIVHPSIEAPLRNQSNDNKPYSLALEHHLENENNDEPCVLEFGHHFETKATATNRTHDQSNSNKSLALLETKATATNRTSSHRGPLRDQSNNNKSHILALADESNGNKSHILALWHHFEAKATATNHTSLNWGTSSRPKQRQQIVHLRIGAPLRNQSNGNKSYIFSTGHHFKTKATPTNRTS